MRRLIVCADDYALTPGVSRSIRELLAARRISATSVMAASDVWPAEAAALKAVAGDADIGLHVTLTDQMSLAAMATFAPDRRLPPMAAVYRAGAMRRLPTAEIQAEIERQLARFIEHYGAPPSHIDGHHHVHQLPGVREMVIACAARFGGRTWVRNCHDRPAAVLARGVASPKAMLIGAFGRALGRLAKAASVPTNQGFSGAYAYGTEKRPLDTLFDRFLTAGRDNHLVMCHPGHADAMLASLDVMTTARDAEHAFFMSEAWPRLMASHGFQLGPLCRH